MRLTRRLSLFWRVFLVEALVMGVAATLLVVGPFTVSEPVRRSELLALVVGLAAMLGVAFLVLHRTLRPLETLTETMRRIDPLSPGQRVSVDAADPHVVELSRAFNDMLGRLEHEQRESARMALSVQESERRRVARELHDEVGQTLTAMLLQVEGLAPELPAHLRDEIEELRETARTGAEEVRRIAQRLRPEALEELGLPSALLALSSGFAEQTGVETDRRIARDLQLSPEQELVVYRVAQEALTNIARHADARHAELSLVRDDGEVVLRVRDDGRGAGADDLGSSYGVRGMRERAMLIGAALRIDAAPGRGTDVVLRIPRED
jgi:two-component system, NarL family, sensor histidine kinase UhpB